MPNDKEIRTMVRRACNKSQLAIDSDKKLIAEVWKMCGWDNSKSLYENLKMMPTAGSITRTRRRLVEEGLIEPSIDATERRYRSFKQTRKNLGYKM